MRAELHRAHIANNSSHLLSTYYELKLYHSQSYETGTNITLVLQIRRLRLGEIR